MEQIKNILPAVLADLKSKKAKAADSIQEIWRKNVEKKQFKHARALSLRAGKLKVLVDSSGWLYQFNLDRQKILAKLNRSPKLTKEIKEIVFRLGELK